MKTFRVWMLIGQPSVSDGEEGLLSSLLQRSRNTVGEYLDVFAGGLLDSEVPSSIPHVPTQWHRFGWHHTAASSASEDDRIHPRTWLPPSRPCHDPFHPCAWLSSSRRCRTPSLSSTDGKLLPSHNPCQGTFSFLHRWQIAFLAETKRLCQCIMVRPVCCQAEFNSEKERVPVFPVHVVPGATHRRGHPPSGCTPSPSLRHSLANLVRTCCGEHCPVHVSSASHSTTDRTTHVHHSRKLCRPRDHVSAILTAKVSRTRTASSTHVGHCFSQPQSGHIHHTQTLARLEPLNIG